MYTSTQSEKLIDIGNLTAASVLTTELQPVDCHPHSDEEEG